MQIDQKMGAFQASMLEAMQSLHEDFQKSKQVEGDQTSASASKPGPSQPKNLDPSKTSADSYDSRVDDASGHPVSSAEEPTRVASTKPKSLLMLPSNMI